MLFECNEENTYKNIQESDYYKLLVFLVCDGYIDESYSDYMSYFYPNSISNSDKIYVRSIKERAARDYAYSLKNPTLVMEYLDDSDFNRREIFNFDLFTHLIISDELFNYLKLFILQLKKEGNYNFIESYYNHIIDKSMVVNVVNRLWPEFVSEIISENATTTNFTCLWSLDTLYYCDKDIITNVNIDNILTHYISGSPESLNVEDDRIEKLIEGFEFIDVRFITINLSMTNRKMFEEVYKNSLFLFSIENINLILKEIFGISEKEVKHKNYTSVLNTGKTPLNQYISNNLQKYIDLITGIQDVDIQDDETVIIDILNNQSLSLDSRREYIKKLSTKISKIDLLQDDELWSYAMESSILVNSFDNIFSYYSKYNEIDDVLINYINGFTETINMENVISDYDKSIRNSLFIDCISCNKLNDVVYRDIITNLGFYTTKLSAKNLPDSKINILLYSNIIRMSLDNLNVIRENYKHFLTKYITKYINQYVDILDNKNFPQDELIDVLSMNIKEGYKLQVLEFVTSKVSIINKGYSINLCVHILENNLDTNDVEIISKEYESYDYKIQQIIFKLVKKKVSSVNPDETSPYLLKDLITDDEITYNTRLNLFISSMKYLNESDIKECFNGLAMPEFNSVFDRSVRPKYEDNQTNVRILEQLKDCNYISKYSKSNVNDSFYRISRYPQKRKNGVA